MNRRVLSIFVALLLAFAFASCEKENIIPDNSKIIADKQYFPLQTGKTLIYKVTEINIDKPSEYYDTTIYFLRERIDIPFVDNEGDTAYRIERFKSASSNYHWKISDAWEAKLTANTAEKVEENQRIIKLRFPLEIGKTWNGNLKNDLDENTCTVSSMNETYANGNINLESCLLITRDSTITQISKIYDCEMYSKGLGLVYKEVTDINSQEVVYGVPIENRIYRGSIYIQELVEIEQ